MAFESNDRGVRVKRSWRSRVTIMVFKSTGYGVREYGHGIQEYRLWRSRVRSWYSRVPVMAFESTVMVFKSTGYGVREERHNVQECYSYGPSWVGVRGWSPRSPPTTVQ
jgi:hypothetical protein